MEPITLITAALTLASPFLVKTGEKIAGKVGEDIWELVKKPFSQEEKEKLFTNLDDPKKVELLKKALIEKVSVDDNYKSLLQKAVENSQGNNSQQNIQNQGNVEKQINIQNSSGSIQM